MVERRRATREQKNTRAHAETRGSARERTDGEVAVLWDGPRRAHTTLVLAHGAGAPMDTPFMQAIAEGLAVRDVAVVRFEFAFMEARRHGKRPGPERMPALAARFTDVVRQLASERVYVGGKSLGSRVAAHVADALGAAGVIALGYPFHPPRRPDTLRVAALAALRTRCLIVHGTRDPFGSPEEIASYALPATVTVRLVADGDHDLMPRKSSGRTHAQNLAEAVAHMEAFMRDDVRTKRVRK